MLEVQPLQGILVALATPFTDDKTSIDENRLKKQVDRLLKAGVHGLVPGGTTGEFTAMTFDERKNLLELCLKYVNNKVPVVAGIGALCTKDAVDLGRHAAKAGAAALMVVPPFYDPVDYDQLRSLVKEVHDTSSLPIVYYNIPSSTGLSLKPKQLAALAEVGVRYLKDTSGNAPDFTELICGHSAKVVTLNGWDTLTFYGLALGAKGTIWGASNIIPELSVRLWEAVSVRCDLKEGRAIWARIWPICNFLESHNYASAVKTAMELQGLETGGMREPFTLLRGHAREELRKLLEDAGEETVKPKGENGSQ